MILPAKYINLGLLVLGFGLGQGSLFLANTYLYWNGHYALVASFGTAHALVTFVYFITDWGGMVYLAKESVVRIKGRPPVQAIYVSLSLVRLVVAILFVTGFYIYQRGEPTSFFGEYGKLAGLGLLAYAFNTSGLLDGASRAGISGLTQALPVVGAAITLPLSVQLDEATAGKLLGTVYALGMAVATTIQIFSTRIRWPQARENLSIRMITTVARESLPYMMIPLPGQALFRGQVLLATAYLPAQLVALFIYARQLLGIGYQGLGFYLRVDLKDFANRLATEALGPVRIVLTSTTVHMGACGTAGLVVVAATLWQSQPDLAFALTVYAPCIVAVAVATTLQRALLLQSRAIETVILLSLATAMPFALVTPIFDRQSIISLVLIEILCQVIQSLLFFYRWRSSRPHADREP